MDHKMKLSTHKSLAKAVGSFKLFVSAPFNANMWWKKDIFEGEFQQFIRDIPYLHLIGLF